MRRPADCPAARRLDAYADRTATGLETAKGTDMNRYLTIGIVVAGLSLAGVLAWRYFAGWHLIPRRTFTAEMDPTPQAAKVAVFLTNWSSNIAVRISIKGEYPDNLGSIRMMRTVTTDQFGNYNLDRVRGYEFDVSRTLCEDGRASHTPTVPSNYHPMLIAYDTKHHSTANYYICLRDRPLNQVPSVG
jgi:hypothetical protein